MRFLFFTPNRRFRLIYKWTLIHMQHKADWLPLANPSGELNAVYILRIIGCWRMDFQKLEGTSVRLFYLSSPALTSWPPARVDDLPRPVLAGSDYLSLGCRVFIQKLQYIPLHALSSQLLIYLIHKSIARDNPGLAYVFGTDVDEILRVPRYPNVNCVGRPTRFTALELVLAFPQVGEAEVPVGISGRDCYWFFVANNKKDR
jgi:hypothetical protein